MGWEGGLGGGTQGTVGMNIELKCERRRFAIKEGRRALRGTKKPQRGAPGGPYGGKTYRVQKPIRGQGTEPCITKLAAPSAFDGKSKLVGKKVAAACEGVLFGTGGPPNCEALFR